MPFFATAALVYENRMAQREAFRATLNAYLGLTKRSNTMKHFMSHLKDTGPLMKALESIQMKPKEKSDLEKI